MNAWYPSTEADDVDFVKVPFRKDLQIPSNQFVPSSQPLPTFPGNSRVVVLAHDSVSISNNPMLWKFSPASFSPGQLFAQLDFRLQARFFSLMRLIRIFTSQHDFN